MLRGGEVSGPSRANTGGGAPRRDLLSSLNYLRESGDIRLLAFCVMPDHYHALLFLTGHKSLSEVVASVSKFTATRLNRFFGRRGNLWQEGFYDHRCRDEDDIEDAMAYIEHNSVALAWWRVPRTGHFHRLIRLMQAFSIATGMQK